MTVTYIVSATWLVHKADVHSIEIDRTVGDIFNAPQVGRCTMRLDNHWGQYNPDLGGALDTADDKTSNDNSGTLNNGPIWVDDGPNDEMPGALDFGADDHYVDVGDPSAVNFAEGDFSLEAWFRSPSNGEEFRFLFWKGSAHSTQAGYDLYVNSAGNIRGAISNGTNKIDITTDDSFDDDTWHHATMVRSADSLALYVDSTERRHASVASLGNTNNGNPLRIGGSSGQSKIRLLSDSRTWNVARTQSEISNNKDMRLAGTENNLVGYWPLDDGLFHNRNIDINTDLKVTAQDSGGNNHRLFTGFVDRIEQDPEPGQEMAIVEASDIARNLRRTLNIPLQVDIPVNSLTAIVLSHASISTTSVDVIRDDAPFSLVDNVSAGEMIRRMMRSGAHFAFVAGDGTFVFRDRNFDLGQSATNSHEQFLRYQHTLDDERISNDVRITGSPRKATTNVQTVAWLQGNPTIAASSSITFFLEYIDPNNREVRTPANSVATPVNSTDYTLNTQADGTGTDLTDTASVDATIFAKAAKIVFFNGSGNEGHITKMKLRGFPLRRTPAIIEQTEVDSSQTQYGRHTFRIDNDLIPDNAHANTYSQYLATRWHDPLPNLRASLKNDDPAILENELLDRVHIVNTVTGVKSDFFITSVNHRIEFATVGREHIAEYGLRLTDSKNYLILDKDPEGKLDVRELGF